MYELKNLMIVSVLMVFIVGCGGSSTKSDNRRVPENNNSIPSNTSDTQAPVITIKGKNPKYRALGRGYSDDGATAHDNVDGAVKVTTEGEVDAYTVGTYKITYTAEDKAGNKATAVRKVIVQNITHNGVTYDVIVSPVTKRVWLDKNLGAVEPCNGDNYDVCHGDFYQWGRNADGHEDSVSVTRTKKINGLESDDGEFVIGYEDWSTSKHRGENWRKSDGSSICPAGFRVPSPKELYAEIVWGKGKYDYPYYGNLDHLKVDIDEHRRAEDGKYIRSNDRVGSAGGLWSYEPLRNNEAYALNLGYGTLIENSNNNYTPRANGYHVRCIKP